MLTPVRIRSESPTLGADAQRRCLAPTRNAGVERRRRSEVGGGDQLGTRVGRVRRRELRSLASLRRQDSPAIWTISTR